MRRTVAEIFADCSAEGLLLGWSGPDAEVTGIAAVQSCGPGDLVFVDKAAYLPQVRERRPACVVTGAQLAARLADEPGLAVLTAPNVGLAQALLRQRYVDRELRPAHRPRIHPAAVIHPDAVLGEGTVVGPCAVIEEGVVVGRDCVVMAGTVLEHGVRLGDRTVIHPNVTVGYDCELGSDVIIHSGTVIGGEGYGFAQDATGRSHRIPQLGRVVIEDRVRVGACNCIDRAAYAETRVGAGTKLDNLCHIAHNVVIGQDCLLTAGLVVAGSTRLGNRVIASGSTGFIDHLTICDGAVFVHKAGVIKDVTEPGVYAGMPIQPMAEYTRNVTAAKKLSEMRARLRELEKQVAALEGK